MSSISRTNGALFTMVSARSASISVKPAPSAPGMARTAKVATSVSRSSRLTGRRQLGQRGQTHRQVVILELRPGAWRLFQIIIASTVGQLVNHPGTPSLTARHNVSPAHKPPPCWRY
jgi:hypothetical protein